MDVISAHFSNISTVVSADNLILICIPPLHNLKIDYSYVLQAFTIMAISYYELKTLSTNSLIDSGIILLYKSTSLTVCYKRLIIETN